jgi:hypothetical protein
MKKLTTFLLAVVLAAAVNAQRVVLVDFTTGSRTISELLIVKASKVTDTTSIVTFVNAKNDLQSGLANTSTDSLLARSSKLFYLSDSVQVLNAAYINSLTTRVAASTVLYRERKGIVKYNDARSVAVLTEVLRARND